MHLQERIQPIVDIVVREAEPKVTVIDLGDVPSIYEPIELEPIRHRDLSHQPFTSVLPDLNQNISGVERPKRDTSQPPPHP